MKPIGTALFAASRLGVGVSLVLLFVVLAAPVRAQSRMQGPVSQELLDLSEAYTAFVRESTQKTFSPTGTTLPVREDFVGIRATTSGEAASLLSALNRLGLEEGTLVAQAVYGWLPIGAIDDLVKLPHLNQVRAQDPATAETASDLEEVPRHITLGPNYPNPFNPQTVIPFSITETVSVRLSIYNLLGNEVDVLVNQVLKPGTYEVTWHPEGLPTGMYISYLEAGSHVRTQRLTLVR